MGLCELHNETIVCDVCKVKYMLTIPLAAWKRYIKGEGPIQRVLSDLTPGERELIISGTCEGCFDRICKEVSDDAPM